MRRSNRPDIGYWTSRPVVDKPNPMKWVSFIPSADRRIVIRAAHHDPEPVYVSGEPGAGKSAIARWIHANSLRSTKPYILCGPGDSLYEKSSLADRGTLVIQDLQLFSEAKNSELHRFIRSHSLIDPASGIRHLARARVIATSDIALSTGSLFYPLFQKFRIHLPSLNTRRSELADIVETLLLEMAHEMKKDHVRTLSRDAMDALEKHTWRRNLRELRNILRFGILSTNTSRIELFHLPDLEDPSGNLMLGREAFKKIEEEIKERC
ncbi:MAG: sigma 54-interacting transcriptional regulator [Cryobacterium sp.]|nr:sigma 54-interacting transcriptional regulator [Oligoflexia bacterium]